MNRSEEALVLLRVIAMSAHTIAQHFPSLGVLQPHANRGDVHVCHAAEEADGVRTIVRVAKELLLEHIPELAGALEALDEAVLALVSGEVLKGRDIILDGLAHCRGNVGGEHLHHGDGTFLRHLAVGDVVPHLIIHVFKGVQRGGAVGATAHASSLISAAHVEVRTIVGIAATTLHTLKPLVDTAEVDDVEDHLVPLVARESTIRDGKWRIRLGATNAFGALSKNNPSRKMMHV
mmetsp:Transcript_13078/g.28244  ORF Transcript_13078/g.28244 Transcript_13078/m.28244 type:complete len:234 (+) Transcript_13078:1220-1921(+)